MDIRSVRIATRHDIAACPHSTLGINVGAGRKKQVAVTRKIDRVNIGIATGGDLVGSVTVEET